MQCCAVLCCAVSDVPDKEPWERLCGVSKKRSQVWAFLGVRRMLRPRWRAGESWGVLGENPEGRSEVDGTGQRRQAIRVCQADRQVLGR